MGNVFSNIQRGEIIRKEGILDYSWEPNNIQHREEEKTTIAASIRPLMFGKKPNNLLVYGKPGVGKTLTLKKVLKDLNDHTSEVKTAYVNCWDHNKEYQVVSEISKQIDYYFFQGKSRSEIFREITRRVKKSKGIVFVFDEIDKVKEHGFLYSIVDNLPNHATSILVTNDKEFIYDLEPRILSRMSLSELEFKPYSKEEIRNILDERVEKALRPDALKDHLLRRIINKTHQAEDIRVGLFLTLQAARLAEQDLKNEIESKHISKAINNLHQFKIKTSFSKLSSDEKTIINIASDKPGLTSGELYTYYQNEGGDLSDRSYRRLLNKLSRLELLNLKTSGKGIRGKTRIINPGPKIKYTKLE